MHKNWDIVWKYTIKEWFKINGNIKYKTICNECGIEWEKRYNTLKKCKFCKPRNRKIIDYWNYIELELTWWEYTKINKEDLTDKIRNYCWYKAIRWNVESRIWNKLIKLHRFIMDAPEWMIVDHINWDKLDNRKTKLRICTSQQNCCNKKASKRSKTWIKWIRFSKWKYNVQISLNWQRHRGGGFLDINDAIKSANNLTNKLHWEYAKKILSIN